MILDILALFGILLAVLFVFGFLIFIAFWFGRIKMTTEYTNKYGWGSFNKFKKEYNKCKWSIDANYNCFYHAKSRFDYPSDSELHASIIKFNGKGMLLDPISMLRASSYMRKFEPPKQKKEKIKW